MHRTTPTDLITVYQYAPCKSEYCALLSCSNTLTRANVRITMHGRALLKATPTSHLNVYLT